MKFHFFLIFEKCLHTEDTCSSENAATCGVLGGTAE